MGKRSMRRTLVRLLALTSSYPLLGAQAQSMWEPLTLTKSEQLRWQPLPPDAPRTTSVDWKQVSTTNKESSSIVWEPMDDENDTLITTRNQRPQSIEEAEHLLDLVQPSAEDYYPLLRLGPSFPTANQVNEVQGAQMSFYQLAAVAGSGVDGGGTGNQNYVGRLDVGVNDKIQISGFYSEADDPLFSEVLIDGELIRPSNFWQSYGGALQWQALNHNSWKLGVGGSFERWNVGSGGSLAAGQVSSLGSPNIFNDSKQRVYTKNFVGSLAFPLTWRANNSIELTFTPGASFLPTTQGATQGGAGEFYGTNFTVGAGGAWKPSNQVTLFGSGLFPLGPGTNSFNKNLTFQKVPILTGGLNYALNPRIALEAALTNGFGGTPATAILALPSANQLMYTARMAWNPQATDTPKLNFTNRSRSLTLGGLSVNTALVPPASVINVWANADDKGNLFSQVGWSASNDFQFILFDAGAFQQVSPITPLVSTYANNGGFNQRFGGKAVFLQQLRGAPLTASGAITLGRNYDASSFQGYLYAEAIGTWEANDWLALNLNPKLAWSGVDTPFGIGVSANVQLGSSFQLIPEVNAVATDVGSSNATLSLRWLARDTTALDVYVSNAAGVYDIGQLLRNDSARVGAKFTIQL